LPGQNLTASSPIPLTLKTLPWALALVALYLGYSIGLHNGLVPLAVAFIVALSIARFGGGSQIRNRRSSPVVMRPRPVMMLIAVLIVLVCWPALKADFLADDFAHLHLFYQTTLAGFIKLFATDFSQGLWKAGYSELRPVAALFYRLPFLAFGTNPVPYHALDIAVHILNTCLLFRLVRLLAPGGVAIAATAALFFGISPIHAEPISWISGARADSYPTFFYLLSMGAFVSFQRDSRWASYLVAWLSLVAGLFTKEILITLPASVVAFAFLFNPWKKSQLSAHLRHSILVCAPFVFAALGYLWWRWLVFGTVTKGEAAGWTQVRGLLAEQDLNLRQLLFPFLLEPVRLPGTRFLQVVSLLAAGMLLGILWARIWRTCDRGSARTSVVPGVGIVWYLLSQAPLIFTYSSERHLYLPSAGFYVAFAAWLMPDPVEKGKRWPHWAGVCAWVVLSGAILFQRTQAWGEIGEFSRQMRLGLHKLETEAPAGSWVTVTAPDSIDGKYAWNWALPFALQPPFTQEDLYARLKVLETPALYCCPMPDWWSRQKPLLTELLAPAHSELVAIHDCRWNARERGIILKKVLVNRNDLRNRLEARMKRSLAEIEVPGVGTAGLVWDSLQAPFRHPDANPASLVKDLTRAFIDREAFIEPGGMVPLDIHSGRNAFLSRFSRSTEERPCLVTVANSQIRFPLAGLPRSSLRFGIALVDDPLDPIDARVTLREAGGTEHRVFSRRLSPRRVEEDRYWQDYQVDLPSVSEGTSEIIIEALQVKPGTGSQLGWNGLEVVRMQ
jgi:hypothetical protein